MSERSSDPIEYAAQPPNLSLQTSGAALGAIIVVALGSVYYFYSRGLSNLYGDGLAHVEGARRLFDSLTPGYAEIGSAWLPLYHILASPLALNTYLWRTGLAGTLISAAAFVVTAWFLFRLSFELNRNVFAAILSLVIFCFCPSMAYLASAPLTEPLTLMWTVLVVFGLFRFQQSGKGGALIGAALAAFFGTLTRYDGWYLLPFAAAFVFWARTENWRLRFRRAAIFLAACSIPEIEKIGISNGYALGGHYLPHSRKVIPESSAFSPQTFVIASRDHNRDRLAVPGYFDP